MPITKNVPATTKSTKTSQEIDGVLSGVQWDVWSVDAGRTKGWNSVTGLELGTITYSFPDDQLDYPRRYGSGEPKTFSAFNPDEAAAVRTVFNQIMAFTLLTLVDATRDGNGATTDSNALIKVAKADLTNAEAWSYYPSSSPEGGDAWFNTDPRFPGGYAREALEPGDYTYTVYMHELGHSLGLKHSFEGGKNGTVPIDSLEYTVMSYSSYAGANDWFATDGNHPQTFMMYDIAALQYMYGADVIGAPKPGGGIVDIDPGYVASPSDPKFIFYNPGSTTYTFDPESNVITIQDGATAKQFDPAGDDKIFLTIWDNGGTEDTYHFGSYGVDSSLTIDLRPGHWTITSPEQLADLGNGEVAEGNIANALTYKTYNADGSVTEYFGSLIENAKGGSGADDFYANVTANEFTGNAHNTAEDADTFIWASFEDLLNPAAAGAPDVIWDFQDDSDLFDLPNQVQFVDYEREGNDGYIVLDVNGTLDRSIQLIGAAKSDVTAADFI